MNEAIVTVCFILGVCLGWIIHGPHHDKKNLIKLDPNEWMCCEWTILDKNLNDFECTKYKMILEGHDL
jgi:hypothetical protein